MSKIINLHAIHTVAPSNLNRDDTGSPKTAVFGGVKRHRVSSQSWKKAIRDYFRENGVQEENGSWRTRHIIPLLAKELQNANPNLSEPDAITEATRVLREVGLISGKDDKNSVLTFISEVQLKAIAEAVTEDPGLKKNELKKLVKSSNAFDIALFGRMVAQDPDLNVEASIQVAHPISTHAVTTEFDFFVGSDDLKTDQDHAGAAMLGDIEFVSSTLYRYATVNVDHLAFNLLPAGKDAVEAAVEAFIAGFVNAVPSGKQNSFATHSKPAFVLIHVSDQALSLASSFEKAVKNEGGYETKSINLLVDGFKKVVTLYEISGEVFVLSLTDVELEGATSASSISELKTLVLNALQETE